MYVPYNAVMQEQLKLEPKKKELTITITKGFMGKQSTRVFMNIPKESFMIGEQFFVDVGVDNSTNEKKVEKLQIKVTGRVVYHRGTE